jgi:uncharacterized protein
VIVPDINLLLHAYDAESPFHEKAVGWWEGCLSGTEPIGLPQVVAFGFVRVGTSARAFRRPMTTAEAAGHVRSWLVQPAVQLLDGGRDHVEQVLTLLQAAGTAGNIVTDAQIAAIALAYDAILHTADTDFVRFPRLRWLNPITGIGTRSLRGGR